MSELGRVCDMTIFTDLHPVAVGQWRGGGGEGEEGLH